MSTSSEYSGFSGNRPVKTTPEKSTFSQTCSLLSQYLKDKGTFGDLTLGMTRTVEANGSSSEASCHPPTTMELFPTILTQRNLSVVDFFSPEPAYLHQSELPTFVNMSSGFKSVEKEPKSAPLTIFYAGQVIVFNDFPPGKMEEIMALASKGMPQSPNYQAYAHTRNQQGNHTSFVANVPQPSPIPTVRDLPIARKVSLHRFFEKRKHRIAANAPYQINNLNSVANKHAAESIPWLGFGVPSKQI
ncbi:protein TIFY 10A-like [Vigna umbellata]|uniref:protein TIFY 10A-like n=1 Tax=Vigna umbellata TaxID=87088 RepID=UPI001F5F7CCA|nr:protein TIFY 10A-like [Vigna umbellata]